MRSRGTTFIVAVIAWGVAGVGQACAQGGDRFQRFEPGLIVETGARMGACDVVAFTPDGKYLMAVGDDKVVRIWKHTEKGLESPPEQILRWSIFREARGNIYAMALSPDPQYRQVAVAGASVRIGSGSVVILDRTTGEVKRALEDAKANLPGGGGYFATWSLAYSPSGNRVAYGRGDGEVGVWVLNAKDPNEVIRLPAARNAKGNKVRLVAFLDENQLISLTEDGLLGRWDLSRPAAPPVSLHQFAAAPVWQARLSPDRRWVGAVSQRGATPIEAFSLKGEGVRTAALAQGRANSLAFDYRGERLAVSVWSEPRERTADLKRNEAWVDFYDLRAKKIAVVARGLWQRYHPDSMTFSPPGNRLVVAGGANQEVTVWDITGSVDNRGGARKPIKPQSVIVSPGNTIWQVALAANGKSLGFKDQLSEAPATVNQRGEGPWRIFDLERRILRPPATRFDPVLPLEKQGDWSVVQETASAWYLQGPKQERHLLPLDSLRDAYPRCYTFLPGKSVRLAVGHFWGISIFQLGKDGLWRTRLMVGHQGEVVSVAPSADGKFLVSGSRDQTIAFWSLEPFPSHPELGARFVLRGGKALIDEVDIGSPAWEADLRAGDEVTFLAFNARKVAGGPEAWIRQLQNPVPGLELRLDLKRQGQPNPIATLTTVRQRPLWRFFPTRDGEWVLWRWRDYYYDCSTNGDSYVGWQVSGDVGTTPAFYRAEQFRKRFYRPDKIADMLANLSVRADLRRDLRIPDIEPPEVRLLASHSQVTDSDLEVLLAVKARGQSSNHQLNRVLLWINDYQLERFEATGSSFEKKLVIPRARLRKGPNLLTLQCYNNAEIRGEAPAVVVDCVRQAAPPKLFGLMVGIGDYSQAKRPVSTLNADRDAKALHQTWLLQKNKYYADADLQLLVNQDAGPERVLKQLAALAGQVQPDDYLVLFLGGHGTSDEDLDKLIKSSKKLPGAVVDHLPPRSFAFVGPRFDLLRPNSTCLTSKDLYEAIAHLACHKLVLLDTCHAGTVAVNPVRELTRDGVGPVILTACQPNEKALEEDIPDQGAHGLFTRAVRRAVQDEFSEADADASGLLDAGELVRFVKARVQRFVKELREDGFIKESDSQNPTDFLPRLEQRLPVAAKQQGGRGGDDGSVRPRRFVRYSYRERPSD